MELVSLRKMCKSAAILPILFTKKYFLNFIVELESAIDTALEAFQMYDNSPKDEKLTYSEIEKVDFQSYIIIILNYTYVAQIMY